MCVFPLILAAPALILCTEYQKGHAGPIHDSSSLLIFRFEIVSEYLDQTSVRDTVSCKICFSPFKNPHLYVWVSFLDEALTKYPEKRLECGHTFCLQCICQWLEVQLLRFSQDNMYKPLSALQLRALREPQLFPALFADTSRSLRTSPPPICTCPACRAALSRKPVKAREMEYVIDELVSSIGSGETSTNNGRVRSETTRANRLFERCLLL